MSKKVDIQRKISQVNRWMLLNYRINPESKDSDFQTKRMFEKVLELIQDIHNEVKELKED